MHPALPNTRLWDTITTNPERLGKNRPPQFRPEILAKRAEAVAQRQAAFDRKSSEQQAAAVEAAAVRQAAREHDERELPHTAPSHV